MGFSWRIALVVIAGCSYTPPLLGDVDARAVDAAIDAQVVCTPGGVECNGRFIETCNATGNGYDLGLRITCPLVCEPGAPPTCLAASNLAESDQRACDASAPPFAPVDGVVLVGAAGITCAGTNGCGTTTTIAPLPSGGALLGFCVSRIEIPPAVTVTFDPALAVPVAMFVDGAVLVDGTIDASGAPATMSVTGASGGPGGGGGGGGGVRPTPGGVGGGTCGGGGGVSSSGSGGTSNNGGGGAGGGFRGRGGVGGAGRTGDALTVAGGTASTAASCGVPELVPLLGGAGGGGGGDGTGVSNGPGGGGGAGALQISSRGSIAIAGAIRVNGGGGFGNLADSQGNAGGSGGGGGGAILLEARAVATTGALEVAGGVGGAANAGAGAAPGQGGNGGAGQDASANGQGGAGGGGSAGRVRINGNNVTCTNVSPAPACSMGSLRPAS